MMGKKYANDRLFSFPFISFFFLYAQMEIEFIEKVSQQADRLMALGFGPLGLLFVNFVRIWQVLLRSDYWPTP